MIDKISEIKELFDHFHIITHEFYSDDQMVKKETKISSNNFKNNDDKLSFMIEFSEVKEQCYLFMFLHATGERYKDLTLWDFVDEKHHVYYRKINAIVSQEEKDNILKLFRNE